MTHPLTPRSSFSSSSPRHSSPLAAPPLFSPQRDPSPSDPSAGPSRRRSYIDNHAETHSQNDTPGPRRRLSTPSSLGRPLRSSLAGFTPSSPPPPGSPPSHPSSPPLSRSQPLLGSYQLSLLHSRMSRTTPHSLAPSSSTGFALHIGAAGKGRSCPPHLRSPAAITVPFSATYYDLQDPSESTGRGAAAQSPWTGTIDVEQRYHDLYEGVSSPGAEPSRSGLQHGRVVSCPSESSPTKPTDIDPPPAYPGYQIAPVGQLQIIIKSASSPLKAFCLPYDLRKLPVGGRLLLRERTFIEAAPCSAPPLSKSLPSGTSIFGSNAPKKEYLRYAIQLQITCAPATEIPSDRSPHDSSTTRRPRHSAPSTSTQLDTDQLDQRAYYVSKSIKVIFTSQPPESGEHLRTERTDELVLPSTEGGVGVTPHSLGRWEEWEMVRRKWAARRTMEHDAAETAAAPLNGLVAEKVAVIPMTMQQKTGRKDAIAQALAGRYRPPPILSPQPTSIPLPILSPVLVTRLPTIHSASPALTPVPSRPTTPTTAAGELNRPASPAAPPTAMGPSGPAGEAASSAAETKIGKGRYGARRVRQGSGSHEDRELSERFRQMVVGQGLQSIER